MQSHIKDVRISNSARNYRKRLHIAYSQTEKIKIKIKIKRATSCFQAEAV